MYFNSGYLNNSRLDFKDYSKPLVVGSCGTYRLKKRPKLPTFWAKGRRDYQILYVASGKAHFWFCLLYTSGLSDSTANGAWLWRTNVAGSTAIDSNKIQFGFFHQAICITTCKQDSRYKGYK